MKTNKKGKNYTNIIIEKEDPNNKLESLNSDQLIDEMSIICNSANTYEISQKANKIKSLFYKNLKSNSLLEKNKKKEKNLNLLETKFKTIYKRFQNIKYLQAKKLKEEERRNLKKRNRIIQDINVLRSEKESLKNTFEKFKSLQLEWRKLGKVPIKEKTHIWRTYNHHIELFYDYIKINKELRELDFKKNLEEKMKICRSAERLIKEKSLKKRFENLQELHEKWKNIGPVKKSERKRIWGIFKTYTQEIHKKRNDFFVKQKDVERKNLNKRSLICQKIMSLSSNNPRNHLQWKNITEQSQELIKKWKKTSPINRKDLNKSWKELKNSTNKLFNERNKFYKEKKESLKRSLKIKISICEKAENLSNSNEWHKTTKLFLNLQKEWKNAPFTPNSTSIDYWKRFKKASNNFFKRRQEYYNQLEKKENLNLKEKEQILKEIQKFKVTNQAESDILSLQKIYKKWNNIGHIPKNSIKINLKFKKILTESYNKLKITESDKKNIQFKIKIDSIKKNPKSINRKKNQIQDKISEIEQTILQYENNISFLNDSNHTFKKDILQKIEISKSDIVLLKEKLSILNRI